ncbi:ABC transporter permease [Granulicella sp. S156]|uniref:ABC transporter permease n=1 Tax=Granulicella sp. S156 TaxID=1747224 RepID=UPI00131E6435|nr:ABC transporter permease [Granulicella sp. S156]
MAWISRLRALLGRDKLAKGLEEELEFHLSMREQWNVDHGMPQAEARRDARRRFGNPTYWRERMNEIDLMILPQTILQDLRYGARMLHRQLRFTIVSVLALALGIGINVATFTAYKGMIARSLDARDPGKMVNLALVRHSGIDSLFSYPDYEAYRDHLHSFTGVIAAINIDLLTLSGVGDIGGQRKAAGSLMGRLGLIPPPAVPGNAELASAFIVSENYFQVLGVTALRGRTFEAGDASKLAASPYVLISENYWQRRFAGDPTLLGKTIRLNGVAFTIIGITPHNFAGTSIAAPDFWLPLTELPLLHPGFHFLRDREEEGYLLYARLAPGVSRGQAQAEMTLLADHLRTLHDPHLELSQPASAQLSPGSPFPNKMPPAFEFAILVVMVAVGMVLLIACANVASLQLARAASRQNELSMRLSLGASRMRLIRQLLTESALLGLLAGVVAFLFSWAFLQVASNIAAGAVPVEYGSFIVHVTPDIEIFAYVFAISLIAGILFGLAPALESSASALSSALKTNAGTSPVRSRRLRDILIASQVAISLMLMIAGSILIRSSIHQLKMDTGYESKHVINLNLRFPEESQYTASRETATVREIRTRLATLPGVTEITIAEPPDGPSMRTAAISLNGEKPSTHNTRALLYYTYVQPNYLQTLGIPLLSGHNFRLRSGQPEPFVILSESAAKRLWPGKNPIGLSLRMGTDEQYHGKNEALPDGPAYQVIGIARDTRGVLSDGRDSAQVYLPLPEDHLQDHPILIRTQPDAMQLKDAIGPAVAAIDPSLMTSTVTLDEMLRQTSTFVVSSIAAAIASTIGVFGLLLATMGIYGTVSYIVVLRTREVGIRMALGAKRRDVLELMLRTSTRPVLAGLLAGMVLAVGASYLLRGLIYGLNSMDGLSFIGVSLLFLTIALLAAYLPSRRAMRVDPVVALRYE